MNRLPISVLRVLSSTPPFANDGSGWRDYAACRGTDTDSFYPGKGESSEVARKICRRCFVSSECLQYSIDMRDENGIWGGIPEGQRKRLLRRAA